MNTYIILLRGVNVGGNNLLPMKALKALLENEGYKNVKSYIQSGNIVLKAKVISKEKVATLIASNFGFTPEVLVLGVDEFKQAITANPFTSFEGKTVHFYFCCQPLLINKDKLETLIAADESYHIQDNVFYLHAPSGIGRSKLVAKIEPCLGSSGTGRNLNTVKKIHEMLNAMSDG